MKNQPQHNAYEAAGVAAASGPGRVHRARGRFHLAALALIALLMAAVRPAAAAQSLYVIAETSDLNMQQVPLLACDIAPDGKLTSRARRTIPLYGAGAAALASDAGSNRLFVTYRTSNVVVLVDAVTLETVGTVTVKGGRSLTGVVYDNDKRRLYCVDEETPTLHVFDWKPADNALIPVAGSPLRLEGLDSAGACGIALDEGRDELYVGGPSTSIGVYSTSDWRLVKTISVSRPALSVAVDPFRQYLYYGGGLVESYFLGQYDLRMESEQEVPVDNLAGAIGIGVDPATGFVFISTGSLICYCGHDLVVYDTKLVPVSALRGIGLIGVPGGLVVSEGPTPRPLRLTKTIKTDAGDAKSDTELAEAIVGEEVTYSICFDHNDLSLTDIVVVDRLPAEIAFVRATGDGVYGRYDPQTHSYTWSDPPLRQGSTTCLELVGRLDPNTPVHQLVTNWVTIDSNETPPAIAEAHAVAMEPRVYKPLHVSKAVIAGATGGGTTATPATHAGDEVTYRITFDNRANEYAVRNVRLTDTLPPKTEFVRATGDRESGHYELLTRTYTWSYPRWSPGESNSVDLVLRMDEGAPIGATIHNTVMLVSDDTTAVTASADVVVASLAPLRLQKTLVRGAVGQPDQQGRPAVDAGATLTYALYFSNPSANKTVTDISLVDTLPRDVSFVSADGGRDLGFYDPNTHTYTWHYASLGSGLEQTLNLTVRVNDKVAPDTVISNSAAITAKQTMTTRAQSDVVVRAAPPTGLPLRLQKTLARGAAGPVDDRGRSYVDAGATLTYAICFSNPATNGTATQVSLVDTLPREVSFISADDDRDFGFYDAGMHTYTWRYVLLAPGAEKVLNLVVRVNEKVAPGTVIANSVTIRAGEVPPTTARLEVAARGAPAPDVKSLMYIKPGHIYRNYPKAQTDLMVVVHLPEGTGAGAISNTPLVLTPGNVKATGQQIFGTSTQGKVLCFFDVDPILTATQGYGEFPLKVTGALKDGRSFVAATTISILKFGGP